MLEKIKANFTPFLLGAITTVLGLASMICYLITNGLAGYSLGNGFATFLAILVFALPLVYTVAVLFLGADNYVSALLGLLEVIFAIILLGIILNGRILTIAAVFSYDSGNKVAWSAVYSAVAGIVLLLLSSIVMTVAGFIGKKKEAK